MIGCDVLCVKRKFVGLPGAHDGVPLVKGTHPGAANAGSTGSNVIRSVITVIKFYRLLFLKTDTTAVIVGNLPPIDV